MNSLPAKLVLFDLDGTVYLDGHLLDGALACFDALQCSGVAFGFMTNNSSVAPAQYFDKLRGLGLPATAENILTSCDATCLMLADLELGPDLFVLGTRAFREYLATQGYRHTDRDPTAVLVGFDKELDYARLTTAVRLLGRGVPLVASHPDLLCPSAQGPLPDAGVLLAALRAATGVRPRAIAGKPHRWIVQLARRRFGVRSREIIIVGDRLQTDIRMAHRYGMRSVLVLSGVTRAADLAAGTIRPTWVVDSIADLVAPPWHKPAGPSSSPSSL